MPPDSKPSQSLMDIEYIASWSPQLAMEMHQPMPYMGDVFHRPPPSLVCVGMNNNSRPGGKHVPDVSVPEACRALLTSRVVDIPFNQDRSGGYRTQR